jgi:hypothetical protein
MKRNGLGFFEVLKNIVENDMLVANKDDLTIRYDIDYN